MAWEPDSEARKRGTRRAWAGRTGGGAALAIITVLSVATTALALSLGAHTLHPWLGMLVDAVLIWFTLALRSLVTEGRLVAELLSTGDLAAARAQVSRVVARRTDVLDESGIGRAVVESLSENVVDGIIAPLFWAMLLGPAGAWLHKGASTLDSMVGCPTERYAKLGMVSARLDDALAWLPARFALIFVPLAAFVSGYDARGSWHVGLRDRRKHASPNSAHGEATFAGALHLRLGGPIEYPDRTCERPLIGRGSNRVAVGDIRSAIRLVVVTGTVAVVSAIAILCVASAMGAMSLIDPATGSVGLRSSSAAALRRDSGDLLACSRPGLERMDLLDMQQHHGVGRTPDRLQR